MANDKNEKPDFGNRKIKVIGTFVTVKSSDLELTDNTSADMRKTPGMLAFWGAAHASAVQEEIQVDARYRAWRAQMELKTVSDGKPGKKGAEPKKPSLDDVKRAVESDPTFLKCKDAIAEAAHNVALTKAVFGAYEKRANLLQSTGATKRAELENLGATTTPAEPKGKGSKGKKGKAADPTPDIEEDDEEEDDDFEEEESAATKAEADDEEVDDDDLEVDDDDDEDDDEEEEKPKGKAGKGAKGGK